MISDSSSDEELFPLMEHQHIVEDTFGYNDPLLVSGILRAVVEEDIDRIKELVLAGQSPNINDNNGNTPLHVAVIKNNIEIVKYLASVSGPVINKRNWVSSYSPLFIAVKHGYYDSVVALVENGADVNLPNEDKMTPLHCCVPYPEITKYLIIHGADLDAEDYICNTPLHDAVFKNCLETVCLLLYYGADPNPSGANNLTPFMKALAYRHIEIQEVLFEYVIDYNASGAYGYNLLTQAILFESPFVAHIVDRGGEVNIEVIKAAIRSNNVDSFELVWRRFSLETDPHFNVLHYLYEKIKDRSNFLSYLKIVFKYSDDQSLEHLASTISSDTFMGMLFDWARTNFLRNDEVTEITCVLLEYGFKLCSNVSTIVFSTMGMCELLYILLYMNHEDNWSHVYAITPRIMFDISCDIETMYIVLRNSHIIINQDMLAIIYNSLSYWIYPPLMDMAMNEYNELPSLEQNIQTRRNEIASRFADITKVPSLLQLARDQTRKCIINKFNIKSTCQFYTLINHMEMSVVYKKILRFEIPTYKFNFD